MSAAMRQTPSQTAAYAAAQARGVTLVDAAGRPLSAAPMSGVVPGQVPYAHLQQHQQERPGIRYAGQDQNKQSPGSAVESMHLQHDPSHISQSGGPRTAPTPTPVNAASHAAVLASGAAAPGLGPVASNQRRFAVVAGVQGQPFAMPPGSAQGGPADQVPQQSRQNAYMASRGMQPGSSQQGMMRQSSQSAAGQPYPPTANARTPTNDAAIPTQVSNGMPGPSDNSANTAASGLTGYAYPNGANVDAHDYGSMPPPAVPQARKQTANGLSTAQQGGSNARTPGAGTPAARAPTPSGQSHTPSGGIAVAGSPDAMTPQAATPQTPRVANASGTTTVPSTQTTIKSRKRTATDSAGSGTKKVSTLSTGCEGLLMLTCGCSAEARRTLRLLLRRLMWQCRRRTSASTRLQCRTPLPAARKPSLAMRQRRSRASRRRMSMFPSSRRTSLYPLIFRKTRCRVFCQEHRTLAICQVSSMPMASAWTLQW